MKAQFLSEMVAPTDLKPHPKNYRKHPADQLQHIVQSIKEHGFYKNVVIANDNTILAGHGAVQAAMAIELASIPATRLDIGPNEPRALKLLTADNEIQNFAETDDRILTELLKEIKDTDSVGLLGTGYDEQILANLVMVTRPAAEISDFAAAAEWVGMPEFESAPPTPLLILSFKDEDDRARLMDLIEVKQHGKHTTTLTSWWPMKERNDEQSIRFEIE